MRVAGSIRNYRGRKVVVALGTTVLSLALCTLSSAPTSFAQTARLVSAGKVVRSPDGSSAASKLKGIAAAAAKESKATFSITYTSTGSGTPTQFTIEQKLPDQLFKSSSGEAIFNGKKTYYCTTSGKSTTCITYGAIDTSPLEGLVDVYSAGTYITIMQSWQTVLAYVSTGVHISFTGGTFAGQASQCVSWSYQGSSAKYCVTDKGILAYVGGGSKGSNSNFELTRYSSSVNSSDFNLPKGAKMAPSP
jgi:hypothetical protein